MQTSKDDLPRDSDVYWAAVGLMWHQVHRSTGVLMIDQHKHGNLWLSNSEFMLVLGDLWI